jgi:hypothetical protein
MQGYILPGNDSAKSIDKRRKLTKNPAVQANQQGFQ